MKIVKDYINLLPREKKKPFPLMPAFFLLFVLAWIGAFGFQLNRGWQLQDQLRSVNSKNQMLHQEVSSLQQDLGPASRLAGGAAKNALIHDLLTKRVMWSEVFKQFSLIVPTGVWFESLEGDSSGGTEIKIKGSAYNYLTLGQFMSGLEKSDYFVNPQLRYGQKKTEKGREIVAFEIVCQTKRGDSVK